MSDSLRPRGLQPTRFLCPWGFRGKNTGVGCHFLLHEIFLIQGSNLHLLRCRQILYQGPPGKPSVPLKGRRILGTWAGLPGGSEVKVSACVCLQCGRPGFDSWVWKIFWRRKWQPTPVFLPGESHGQRSLAGCSPRGRKESDTTE